MQLAAHASRPHTPAHARTHAQTHACTHTHTHKGAHTEERRATNSSAVASKVGRGLAVTVNRLVHQLLLPALSVHPCQPFHLIRISLPSLVKDTAPPIPFSHSPGSPGRARMRLASQPAAHTGAQTNSSGERRRWRRRAANDSDACRSLRRRWRSSVRTWRWAKTTQGAVSGAVCAAL